MSDRLETTWTRTHDLALVYVALAYETDQDLTDEELNTITSLLQSWQEELSVDQTQELVMEAIAVYLEGRAPNEVERAAARLADSLSDEERTLALEHVIRIAEADGVLLSSERSMIALLAEQWDVKAAGERLLDQAAEGIGTDAGWSLLHDIALLYIVLAHSTDNELSRIEVDAIVRRVGDWEPELDDEEVRAVIREALAHYAEEPSRESLMESVASLKGAFSVVQRLVLLDDMVFIAEADGGMTDNEREMIDSLARAWEVAIRLNGRKAEGE